MTAGNVSREWDQAVLSGLVHPSVVQFSPDGRIFVAEKRGTIKVFDSLTDTTPVTFTDLQSNVDDYWDRGLLGMALAPNSRPTRTSTSCTPTTRRSEPTRQRRARIRKRGDAE